MKLIISINILNETTVKRILENAGYGGNPNCITFPLMTELMISLDLKGKDKEENPYIIKVIENLIKNEINFKCEY